MSWSKNGVVKKWGGQKMGWSKNGVVKKWGGQKMSWLKNQLSKNELRLSSWERFAIEMDARPLDIGGCPLLGFFDLPIF
ncbi:hypothetical protein CKO51_21450 [Rhodopirellula sp. SM50]|nr:hypothetical protein [Rhodopirellula sp. SM50]PAY17482.1 hypothetical protein CKO51_21450 [Rhodopirellula sp. SM50]